MQFFLSLLGFLFLLITCGMGYIAWKVHKGVKNLREAMRNDATDDDFQRKADKYYYKKHQSQGPAFDEEYFKGDPTGAKSRKKDGASTHQRRTTTTANGVTIIDDRDPSTANKKIFAQDEGEYVDFTEN